MHLTQYLTMNAQTCNMELAQIPHRIQANVVAQREKITKGARITDECGRNTGNQTRHTNSKIRSILTGMKAFGDSCRVNQIAITKAADDVRVQVTYCWFPPSLTGSDCWFCYWRHKLLHSVQPCPNRHLYMTPPVVQWLGFNRSVTRSITPNICV